MRDNTSGRHDSGFRTGRAVSALDPALLDRIPQVGNVYSSIDIKALVNVKAFTLDLLGTEGLAKRRWTVILHDTLRGIPLEAVPISPNVSASADDVSRNPGDWPGLSKEIAYAPSLSSIAKLRSNTSESPATVPVTIIADPIMPGDPRYDSAFASALSNLQDWLRRERHSIGHWLGGSDDLAPVPETAELGYAILGQLGGQSETLYAGMRARRSLIWPSHNLQNARVLVFATHGETADSFPDLAEPFLVLTSEEGSPQPFDPLTASEISELSLNAELVILSACNTAAPDGTPGRVGFSGLAQSFLAAGARSLIVSQWEISTGPAQIAITKTLKAGLRAAYPGEALREGRFAVASRFGPLLYILATFKVRGTSSTRFSHDFV